MGGRDPFGGSLIRPGDGYDALGGPLGTVAALGLFVAVAVVLVAVVGGLESLLRPALPSWLVLPVVLLAAAVLAFGGLAVVLRFNEWRRY